MVAKDPPPMIPVTSLRKFVDAHKPIYCTSQSQNIIEQPIIQSLKGSLYTKNRLYAIIFPINTPVHLAHTGNCLPFMNKLRSGIWWQPLLCPSLINCSYAKNFIIFKYPSQQHYHHSASFSFRLLLSIPSITLAEYPPARAILARSLLSDSFLARSAMNSGRYSLIGQSILSPW